MKYKIKLTAAIIISITSIFAASGLAIAQLKPEDEIKYRQSAMMFMRWNMGKIKNQVVKNPQTYNKEQVAAAANTIAAIANSGLGALYSTSSKTGSGWKKTRVKAEYFEQPDDVRKHAQAFNEEAKQLANVAQSGNIEKISEQFDNLFKACKSCHKKFRRKD